MFCYQCEQTSGKGCSSVGVCTKSPKLAGFQDLQVLYNLRLCQLAHTLGHSFFEADVRKQLLESTFTTLTNVNFSDDRCLTYLEETSDLVKHMEGFLEEKEQLPPRAPGQPFPELPKWFDLRASGHEERMQVILDFAKEAGLVARSARVGDEDLFGVVEMATYGLKGTLAYFYHAENLGVEKKAAYSEEERTEIYKEIFRIGAYLAEAGNFPPKLDKAEALQEAVEMSLAVGALNLKVMAILDRAHTAALGTPTPTEVSTVDVGGRPSILVSGHDLGALYKVLNQTQRAGVDVYTHGELLPAHGYPKLKAFPHLKGHFGTHWGNQLHEFKHFPGPILVTSNCLRPPTKKYMDRIWCTGPVGIDSAHRIAEDDFSPMIKQALKLPAFDGEANQAALRGSSQRKRLHTGHAHGALSELTGQVAGAIKSGELKHIFLIGGCDGTESSRNYFTDTAARLRAVADPPDSIVLTMGCGKFRLNAQEHGTLAGMPRLMDVGQCNDVHGALVWMQELADELGVKPQELPVHFTWSWFEQKAVAVLLSFLHMDIKNVRIGPATPAFLTPNALNVMNERFGLRGIDKANFEDDLNAMLEGR